LSARAFVVLAKTSSVGGNATCLVDLLRGGYQENPGSFDGGLMG